MSGLILADKVDVGPFILIQDRFAEIGGCNGPVIPGLAVEVVGDLGRLEDSPVAGEDLIARQAALLPGQILQIGIRQIPAAAVGKQIIADGRWRRRRSGSGRFDRQRRGRGRRLTARGSGAGRRRGAGRGIGVAADNIAAGAAPVGFVRICFIAAVALASAFAALFRFVTVRLSAQ